MPGICRQSMPSLMNMCFENTSKQSVACSESVCWVSCKYKTTKAVVCRSICLYNFCKAIFQTLTIGDHVSSFRDLVCDSPLTKILPHFSLDLLDLCYRGKISQVTPFPNLIKVGYCSTISMWFSPYCYSVLARMKVMKASISYFYTTTTAYFSLLRANLYAWELDFLGGRSAVVLRNLLPL